MTRVIFVFILTTTISLTGCYHAQVTTGLTPSAVVVDIPFASGWVYGLVPPKTVAAAAECPNGIAMVETELSFVNQLVNFLTFGIYTPMHIKVTCAAAGGSAFNDAITPDIVVPKGATTADIVQGFAEAADIVNLTGIPVYVDMDAVGN